MYINFRELDDDHTAEERAYGLILCIFFSVCIIILTVFLQQTNYVSSRLGVKIQVRFFLVLPLQWRQTIRFEQPVCAPLSLTAAPGLSTLITTGRTQLCVF